MSNLGAFGGAKNPPWVRTSVGNSSGNLVNQNNALQQQLLNQGALGNMGTTGMVQFQPQHQQQVFQNMGMQQQNLGLGLQQMGGPSVAMGTQLASGQLFQQVGAVTYPNPRALNPTAFQTQNTSVAVSSGVQASQQTSTKQRVFTGTVTKVHDNFGFVDEDVFFQTSACVKGSNPMVGDRVLVEASYNPNMPFKWNATRIQVLPTNQGSSSRNSNSKSVYSAVPPPCDNFGKNNQRAKASLGGRGRERSRDRDRDEEEMERKKRREERLREREKEERKSPLRRRSRSPKNRRRLSRVVPRYMVQIPKINLDLLNADVLEVRRRYANLYIPSDFFCSYFRWVDAFPPDKPFSLSKPCQFHIMHKDVDAINEPDEVLEPPDADYLFSAKVMLLSVPGMEDLYEKCCAMAEDRDKRERDSEERDFVHPTRLINFLVGLRGKNETMAIGGPWSPSLDGGNPESDPTVLIRTAIRTCKALTGIDLSSCTQWYRFVELYYRRGESVHKGKSVPARVETVALFLPDAWSCLPTRIEWDHLQNGYRVQLDRRLRAATITQQDPPDDQPLADEKEEEPLNDSKLEPTHYSQLDPKSMTVSSLRSELKARGISNKGLKSQLVARLTKCLKAEAEKPDDVKDTEIDLDTSEDKKIEQIEEKQLDEKEKALMEKRYALPDQPHIIVHPSRVAKSGKFDCTTMSLSLLLDYRPEDTKEHSFEVSLFAELFNEMLTRDFGFNIYKALYELPEKVKDKEEKKKKDDDKRNDDDKKKEDDKKEKDRRSEDKKSERKDEDKKRDKKDERKSENLEESEEEDEYEEDETKDKKKSDKERKKKERPKMYTKDRNLLLSFVYFDQTHCGYIFEKDMEDLLFTLGLHLSRAQVRKLVGKVISRDSLHYRKLTDKPKDDDLIVIDEIGKELNLELLASGNKSLLPVFNDSSKIATNSNSNDEGVVVFRGAVVDVSKLMAQLERSDKARLETEGRMIDLKTDNGKLTEKNTKINSTIKSLNSELKDYKERLKVSEDSLTRTTARSKLFQATLFEVRDKIDPVLKSTMYKEDNNSIKKENNDKERKHEEGKSRWEKNVKDAVVKDEPMEIESPKISEIKEETKNAN